MAPKLTRHVPHPIQLMLWGTAAGRCEFAGCNKELWKSSVTQEQVNIAQKAHIYAFSDDGPRGHHDLPDEQIHDISNLMLVCYDCHQKIDNAADGGQYTADILGQMKLKHEQRISLATSIDVTRASSIVFFGSNIGAHSSPLNYRDAAHALFPHRYPAERQPIELGMVNSSLAEHDAAYWRNEDANLVRRFEQRVRERLADGGIQHLSVFALAPQPLLIRLGSLLTDIPAADVYQRHREPAGWGWVDSSESIEFITDEPSTREGPPALILSLSGSIADARVTAVMGDKAALWRVRIKEPHNDFLKSREHLQGFRVMFRRLLNKIKTAHGQEATLHVFPAVPVAVAVEMGRVRMPKADLKWLVYDQVNALGGFVPALDIA